MKELQEAKEVLELIIANANDTNWYECGATKKALNKLDKVEEKIKTLEWQLELSRKMRRKDNPRGRNGSKI